MILILVLFEYSLMACSFYWLYWMRERRVKNKPHESKTISEKLKPLQFQRMDIEEMMEEIERNYYGGDYEARLGQLQIIENMLETNP
jgi:hypothetical protein